MVQESFAHTKEGRPPAEWQRLDEHLRSVSRLAQDFAAVFGSGPWGELAGLWHDLGKYAPDFQTYLLEACDVWSVGDASVEDSRPGRIDHSSAGAIHAYRLGTTTNPGKEPPAQVLALAMIIAGHHAGLGERARMEGKRLRNDEKAQRYNEALRGCPPPDILGWPLPPAPACLRFQAGESKDSKCLRFELWTRMLFSALIDADRLDTEAFENERKARVRTRMQANETRLVALRARLRNHIDKTAGKRRQRVEQMRGPARDAAQRVLNMRSRVLEYCRLAASGKAGRYSLTVPTGGGKTLSAMAFALDHAIANGLRRVIVVIPFTSIIDQTAQSYRDGFRGMARSSVVEHHSNLDPESETVRNRLASENWDAPVVVTTSVQFFESLFSDRPTRCRKLHNITKSVVVFDEAQTLPHSLRTPIFDGLNQLVDYYGCSLLMCTATQPALELDRIGLQGFPSLGRVHEVVADVSAVYGAVSDRVGVEFRDPDKPIPWPQLAAEAKDLDQVLIVVHRRDDARELCSLLPDDAYHLSALMCPAHRKAVLASVRMALEEGRSCRVVSTTLIEAGVDVDFPVVFRAYGGVDAMAQAAGRCNREGARADAEGRPVPGRLVLFRAPSDPPRGLRSGLETTTLLLGRHAASLDLFSHETYQEYFRALLANCDPDVRRVNQARIERNYPEVASRFRMIDDDGQFAVVVPYGDAENRIENYRRRPRRRTLRALQPFLVNVPVWEYPRLQNVVELVYEQVRWLPEPEQYHSRFGLITEEVPVDPGRLVV